MLANVKLTYSMVSRNSAKSRSGRAQKLKLQEAAKGVMADQQLYCANAVNKERAFYNVVGDGKRDD
tara:strand:+ start:186 stop:383 length:198 start_codon:yes stop_codon:yes gene_type:complete